MRIFNVVFVLVFCSPCCLAKEGDDVCGGEDQGCEGEHQHEFKPICNMTDPIFAEVRTNLTLLVHALHNPDVFYWAGAVNSPLIHALNHLEEKDRWGECRVAMACFKLLVLVFGVVPRSGNPDDGPRIKELYDALNGEPGVLTEVMDWLRYDISWTAIAHSGWPIFALLAKVQETARKLLINPEEETDRFPEGIAEFLAAPHLYRFPEEKVRLLLDSANIHILKKATAYVLTAAMHNRGAEVLDDIRGTRGNGIFSVAREGRFAALFLSSFPLWKAIDFAVLQRQVEIKLPSNRGSYWMEVFPYREKVSDMIRGIYSGEGLSLRRPSISASPEALIKTAHLSISDPLSPSSQACHRPYCDSSFFELMLKLPKVDRLIEVGSNIGDCSLWSAAALNVEVIAFDPFPHSIEALRGSVSLNNFQKPFRVVQKAVSGAPGRKKFYMLGAANGNPFALSSSSNPDNETDVEAIDVEVTTVSISHQRSLTPPLMITNAPHTRIRSTPPSTAATTFFIYFPPLNFPNGKGNAGDCIHRALSAFPVIQVIFRGVARLFVGQIVTKNPSKQSKATQAHHTGSTVFRTIL